MFHDYFKNQAEPPPCDYFDKEHVEEINNFVPLMNSSQYNNPAHESVSDSICDRIITEDDVTLHMKK